MNLAALRAFLAAEPRTLSRLEAALGVSLGRDKTGEEAWLVRRKKPLPGVDFLFVAFVGKELTTLADPMLDEVRLFTEGVDLRAEARSLLGAGETRGGEETFDIYHGTSSKASSRSVWSRALGLLEIHDDATKIFWTRHEGDYQTSWPPDEEASLLARIGILAAGELDDARLHEAFGVMLMSGRSPERFLRGPTWKLVVHPIAGPRPKRATITLRLPLPLSRVLPIFGARSMLVATSGVHQADAEVIDAETLDSPTIAGSRVTIRVASLQGATPSAVDVPAQRAYETTGLSASSIEFATTH